MFSERPVGDGDRDEYNPWSDVFLVDFDGQSSAEWRERCAQGSAPPFDTYSFSGINWIRGGPRHTAYNHLFPPNSRIPDCADPSAIPDGGPGAYTARSYHDGGVNVAFADGHVVFVSETIDLETWQALATRNGEETVSPF
jgi:prepilin-type processing-associated H-X9-DG protein